MRIETKTFQIEYKVFEPGERVIATSNRSPLERGRIYTVIQCIPPKWADGESYVFLQDYEYGVSTQYLAAVNENEQTP